MINFKGIAYGSGWYKLYLFFVSLFSSLQLSRLVCPTLIKAILQMIFFSFKTLVAVKKIQMSPNWFSVLLSNIKCVLIRSGFLLELPKANKNYLWEVKYPFPRHQFSILHACLKDDGCRAPSPTGSWGKRWRDTSTSRLSRPLNISSRRNGEMPLKYILKDLVLAFCN